MKRQPKIKEAKLGADVSPKKISTSKTFGARNRQRNETEALAQRMAKIKTATTKCWRGSAATALANVQALGKTVGRFLEKLNINLLTT